MIVQKDEIKYQIAFSLIDGADNVIGKKLLAYYLRINYILIL
ncbi:hypothetical protein OAJ65_01505 [Flavobacteriales bacterium]|nr:hypothetical protein [Flavobacteriales bacterium]